MIGCGPLTGHELQPHFLQLSGSLYFVCTDYCLGYGHCKELAVKLLIHKSVTVPRYVLTWRTAVFSIALGVQTRRK